MKLISDVVHYKCCIVLCCPIFVQNNQEKYSKYKIKSIKLYAADIAEMIIAVAQRVDR